MKREVTIKNEDIWLDMATGNLLLSAAACEAIVEALGERDTVDGFTWVGHADITVVMKDDSYQTFKQ